MKSIYVLFTGAVALTFGLSACIPAPAPAPAPAPVQSAEQPPAPSPVQRTTRAIADSWADQPQTPGGWSYAHETSEAFALFADASLEPKAIIRCDLGTRKIGIGLFGKLSAADTSMQIRTETQDRTVRAFARDSAAPLHAAELSADDALLDAIALTRGRFAIAIAGKPTLYLPAWAEVTRVIEDCR